MRRIVTIHDGPRTIDVALDLERPPGEAVGEGAGTSPDHVAFVRWWGQYAAERGVPYQFGSAEPGGYRIVRKLLRTHTVARLRELAVHFWLRHSGPLREGYSRHLTLFAHVLPEIERELEGLGG